MIHQLSQVRALAGMGSAYTNVHDPRVHKTRCGDMDVTYIIHQNPVGDISPRVYITDIDVGLFGTGNRPGCYPVDRKGNRWDGDDKPVEKIETRNAAINGLADGLERAGRIMPPMVERAYGQLGANRETLHNEGFTLLYNPQAIMIDGKQWKTPEQKRTNSKTVAQKLARQLKTAQKTGHDVQWTIHGNGRLVLQKALELMPGQTLDRHTLMFMAPEGRLDQILPLARRAKMKLHDEVMLYSDHETSLSKFNNTVGHARQVGAEIAAFGGEYSRKGMAIASHGRNALHSTLLSSAFLGLSLGAGLTKTAVSFAIPAILPEQRHQLRNRLASLLRLNDDRLTPTRAPTCRAPNSTRKCWAKPAAWAAPMASPSSLCSSRSEAEMSFLKLFKSDPMNLIGPELAGAPTKRLDLSGSVLSFLHPPTTASVHSVLADQAFDIYRGPETEIKQPFMSAVLIFTGGWTSRTGISAVSTMVA